MKKSLFFGMAALLAAGVSSCSNDDLVPEQDTTLKADKSFFVNVNIASTETMTRAGVVGDYDQENGPYDPSDEPNFDAGDPAYNENEVKSIYLIFYDKNHNRVSTTQVRKDNMQGGNRPVPSENSFYKGVVQIDVKHGSEPPAYVMCFINPITSQNFDINPDFATMASLQATKKPRIIDDNGYFAMSKSVYYGIDRSVDGWESKVGNEREYTKIVATPIAKGQLFETVEDAQDALDKDTNNDNASMVDIYVERYAAKVNFTVGNNANKGITVDGHQLQFVPEYWAVNAYEEETYICKSFLDVDMSSDMTYETLDKAFGNQWLSGSNTQKKWYWNSPENHRCYWAQSPGYYSSSYPRVADDILDKEAYQNGIAGGYSAGYYSYNDMVANANSDDISIIHKARNIQTEPSAPIYARENTVQGKALQDAAKDQMASPKAAIASVVMVGHYTVNGTPIAEDEAFYIMGNATNGYTFFGDYDEALTYLTNTTVEFATDSRGRNKIYNYGITNTGFKNDEYKKYFTLEHPNAMVRGSVDPSTGAYDASKGLVIDSRFVTIQLANDINNVPVSSEDAKLYAYIDGQWIPVIQSNLVKINQQMLYSAGTMQGFQGGKAYFTIPIKHLGFYRDGNKNAGKNANDKNFDWESVQSGDFGLVRNHAYRIVVDNITGLGNGIPDPDDPIVPPTDPEEYFIGARIIVLNWAVVPEQHVNL